MRVNFDTIPFSLSETTTCCIKLFMLGYLRDIRDDKNFKKEKKCWTWGLATIGDFCSPNGIDFQWGGDEDIPIGELTQNQLYVHI